MKGFMICLSFMLYGIISFAQTSFYSETSQAKHWVDSVYKSLSKEQRIAQLMVVRLSSRNPDGSAKFFDDKVTEQIKKYNIGAICLFQGNPVVQATFVNNFQRMAKTPLMICIDGETGVGMRMYDSVMKFPDQLTMGAVNDAGLIYNVGKAMGEQCKRAGIQVDYAPVVDINNNPDNPVIGYRSFGEDKYKVALYGTKIMQGLQDVGVMATAKHFPGHGDVSVDSHLDLPVINKTKEQLDSLELYPFRQLFEAGVGSVMIAHLSIPAIDSTAHQPTSLSKNNVTGLLRNELGFKGISFTDALEMQGVAKYYPAGEAGFQSIIAGNDMLCLPGDVPGTIKRILTAIKKGELDKNDMEARIKKVLLVKYHMGLASAPWVDIDHLTVDLNKDVPALRKAIAENALTVLKSTQPGLLPLNKTARIAYVGVGTYKPNVLATLLKDNYNADLYYFDYTKDSDAATSLVNSLKAKYDKVIIGVHNLSKYPAKQFGLSNAAIQLVKDLQQATPAATLLFGNPYAVKYLCTATDLAICYEDDAIFQQAAFDWLSAKFIAKGTLPVSVCSFKAGDGKLILEDNALPFTTPAALNINDGLLYKVDSIANAGIFNRAYPGCVVLAAKDGKVFFDKAYGYMTYDSTDPVKTTTIFDLASVTKISATNVSVMKLYEDGLLDINKTLGDYLPWVANTDKAKLVISDILLHQAGLKAFIPFYEETIDTVTGLQKPGFYKSMPDDTFDIRVADTLYMRHDWRDTMYARILQSPLTKEGAYIYSDNDFIFLGKVVEQITGKTLDTYAKETFYDPMNMRTTGFLPDQSFELNNIAPTERERKFRLQQLRGTVHDPGSAMFGGVAGHAGLFSDAYDLAKLYEMLLNGGTFNGKQYLKKGTIDFFTAYHSEISRRGYGFDKPEKDNATREEPYPSKLASPQTYGHTGYTGTCVWVDPAYNLVYIFLSNRVYPDGGVNKRLGELNIRGAIQDVFYEAIGQKNNL
ncbi:serine hydrolase [Panacibacter ginsenosidivorans]|uniref:beta-N-acetylhexosaminidase n=1 Tax=Panacibacter ginsenosidivorans TaxID=1813871 RepID=A0A5B8VAA2_9BACT|nr:glycoside hydrolase family 3 N-terminal domain-containing protein [Panacibacter ginsenosidivorans]QEC68282.1 serine hydrolase [Panacibacter ginsenosidivorans]